jgi:hypothetical protein
VVPALGGSSPDTLPSLTIFLRDCARRGDGLTVQAVASSQGRWAGGFCRVRLLLHDSDVLGLLAGLLGWRFSLSLGALLTHFLRFPPAFY